MALTQYTTFTLGEHLYGVEVERVQEVLRFQQSTPVPLAPAAVGGLINLRGQVVTALDLRTRMGLPERGADQDPINVVVRVGGEAVSLLVDVIGEVVNVTDELFEGPPDTLTGRQRELIRGAYKLDGQLLLALDVDRVVEAE
jgi:purine-binding chemotaxis protein CheW